MSVFDHSQNVNNKLIFIKFDIIYGIYKNDFNQKYTIKSYDILKSRSKSFQFLRYKRLKFEFLKTECQLLKPQGSQNAKIITGSGT